MSGDRARFESVDWDAVDDAGSWLGAQSAVLLVGAALIAALYVRERLFVDPGRPTLLGWYASTLDWLVLLAIVVLVAAVVVPAMRDRRRLAVYWRRFGRDRLAVVCLGYLVAYVLIATAGAWYVGRPGIALSAKLQPPVFATSPSGTVTINCLGEIAGDPISPDCHGTWRYPLGTDNVGRDMIAVLARGARVSLLVALVASMLIVPIATAVGTIAGYVGGRVDALLMGYVDVQQAVPAFVVYLIAVFVFTKSLFLLVVVFGLFSWGGTARLVRSEVLQRRDATYVVAAREAGAGHLRTVRRHVVPNVSSTVITSTARQIPMLILTEAALAYLLLSDADRLSWGVTIKQGMRPIYDAISGDVTWWIWVWPALFLAATAFAFGVVGDALRDAMDPRGDG